MKICQYCRTENADQNANCISCSGNAFYPKCNNCGSVVNGPFCTYCGTKVGDVGRRCKRCGKTIFTSACSSCGWKEGADHQFNNYTIINQQQPQNQPLPQPVVYAQPEYIYKTPKRQMKTTTKILLWIFLFPVMLCLAIYHSNMQMKTKGILITAVALLFLVLALTSDNNEKDANAANAPSNIQSTVTTAAPTTSTSATVKIGEAAAPIGDKEATEISESSVPLVAEETTVESEATPTQENAGAITLTFGELGEYGKNVTLDGDQFTWYFLPEGRYSLSMRADSPIPIVFLNKNETFTNSSGYQETEVVKMLNLNDGSNAHTLSVTSDTHIVIPINSIIDFTPID